MTTFTQNLKSIQEAYTGIIAEAREPIFKTGDKVGIGSFTNYGYQPSDTGTVVKVNKFGHHTVEYDKRKNADDNTMPYHGTFDATGKSRSEYSNSNIIPLEQHTEHTVKEKDQRDRNMDMQKIVEHVSGKRNGFGHYGKFDAATAEHIKGLIDKHTASSKE